MVDTFGTNRGSPVPTAIPMGGGFGQYGSQQAPVEAPSSTLIQDRAKAANQGKAGYDVLGNPIKTVVEPTVLTSSNVQDKYIPDMNKRLQSLETGGTYVGQDGNLYYNADGSSVAAPVGSQFTGSGWQGTDGKMYKDAPTYSEDPQQNSLLQAMKQSLDAQTLASIKSIEQSSAVLKQQQERYNKAYEAGTEQALLMGGGARYAPISSGGIQLAAQSFGLEKIAALDAQEKELIARAREAQATGDWKIMGEALQTAETIRKEKQAEASKLAEQRRNDIEAARVQERQMEQDTAISSLVQSGITDPTAIYSALVEGGFETSIKDVSDTLKLLTVSGDATKLEGDLATFQYLQKNGMLPAGITNLDPSQQYFAYLNMNKLAESGKLSVAAQNYGGGVAPSGGTFVGAGAKDSTEEQILRTRLFAKLSTILNKGTLSDTDAERIEGAIATFRAAGLNEQEIMSRLAGFPSDVNTPYNESFISLAAANTETNEQQQTLMAKVGQMLASKDYTTAMNTVERSAMQNVENYGKEDYVGIDDASYVAKKVDSIKDLLGEGWVNEVGLFSGSMSKFLSNKFGLGQASKIAAQLNSLTSSMISKRAGSAITEAEWKRLVEPNIPSVKDSAKTWATKLDELTNDVLMRLNEERRTVSLPELEVSHVLDPQSRLSLYANSNYTEGDDFWGTGNGSYEIYDPNQGYLIPE